MDTEIQEYRDTGIPRYRDTGIQGFARIKGFFVNADISGGF